MSNRRKATPAELEFITAARERVTAIASTTPWWKSDPGAYDERYGLTAICKVLLNLSHALRWGPLNTTQLDWFTQWASRGAGSGQGQGIRGPEGWKQSTVALCW